MKNHKILRFLVIPLLFLPLALALAMYFGDSGLPKDTSVYTGVSIVSPDGSELMYSQNNGTFHLMSGLLDGITPVREADLDGAVTYSVEFFTDEEKRGFTFAVSEDKSTGYVISERERVFRVSDLALRDFLVSNAAKVMYLGSLPPSALLYDNELSPNIVEWYETLSDGSEVSSGQYILDTPKKYNISRDFLSEIIFMSTPTRTELSVYVGEEVVLKTTLSDLSALADIEGDLDLVLIVEWENVDGGTIRAGYNFHAK